MGENAENLLPIVHDALYGLYGELSCPLRHETPFQLLVAVMLSAQCRDDRVNQVTEELFRRWPDPRSLAEATPEEVACVVRSLGLYRNKSRNLVACAGKIVQCHGGLVPRTMEELTALPGIGRKSANVVLGNAFGIPGFPVDTHVIRVLNRLGCVDTSDPVGIERIVTASVPPALHTNFSHLIITHGRRVCHAANPECAHCVLTGFCRSCRGGRKP